MATIEYLQQHVAQGIPVPRLHHELEQHEHGGVDGGP